MVQRIRDFAEALRKDLGIVVKCEACAKCVTYRCLDFRGYINPHAYVEDLTWRCSWCRTPSTWVRFASLHGVDRQNLAQWRPPPWLKRRW